MTETVHGIVPILLSINDTVRVIGLSRPTIYKLIHAGDLRAVKCGGRTMIPMESVQGFVASLPAFTLPTTEAAD